MAHSSGKIADIVYGWSLAWMVKIWKAHFNMGHPSGYFPSNFELDILAPICLKVYNLRIPKSPSKKNLTCIFLCVRVNLKGTLQYGTPCRRFPFILWIWHFFPTKILVIPAPIWISFPNLQITVETAAAVPSKLYIPGSTINIWKKVLITYTDIWADKKWVGFWKISLYIK